MSVAPDGKHMIVMRSNPDAPPDLWVAPLDLSDPDQPLVGNPEPQVRSPDLEYGAKFSPDGKWIAPRARR